MRQQSYDVAVIGLGAVGSATLYQLSKTRAKIIGLDRYSSPHTMGSSHGETRITRLAVGEGEEYVALAKRSHEIWDEIESKTGLTLRTKTGGLLIDSGIIPWSKHGSEGFWDRTVRFAKNQDIVHHLPSLELMKQKFPAFQIPPSARIYFENEAGYLRPELAIRVQLDLARDNGAEIRMNYPCQNIKETNGGFVIECPDGHIFSKKIVLNVGGWIKDFLPKKESGKFKICRQLLHWLEIETEWSHWSYYPVWMWGFGSQPEDFIYGFPSLDGRTVKVASESFIETSHPDELVRAVSDKEQQEFWKLKISGKISGLKNNFIRSEVCFYTVTPDARFVVEPMGDKSDFIWVSACSGHGFKHSAALGEMLAKRME